MTKTNQIVRGSDETLTQLADKAAQEVHDLVLDAVPGTDKKYFFIVTDSVVDFGEAANPEFIEKLISWIGFHCLVLLIVVPFFYWVEIPLLWRLFGE